MKWLMQLNGRKHAHPELAGRSWELFLDLTRENGRDRHHVPHSEDWPVLATTWHEFELRPVNFFAHNAALDLPKQS